MLFEASVHGVSNLVIEMTEALHCVILQDDALDEGLEPMRFKVIITNNFPKTVWSRCGECSSQCNVLMLMAISGIIISICGFMMYVVVGRRGKLRVIFMFVIGM